MLASGEGNCEHLHSNTNPCTPAAFPPVPPQAHRAVMPQLPSQVVACVPQDELASTPWAAQEDVRRTAKFMSYALTAAAEVGGAEVGNSLSRC